MALNPSILKGECVKSVMTNDVMIVEMMERQQKNLLMTPYKYLLVPTTLLGHRLFVYAAIAAVEPLVGLMQTSSHISLVRNMQSTKKWKINWKIVNVQFYSLPQR